MENINMKNIAATILTVVFSGLTMTVYNIFTVKVPEFDRKISVLESEVTNQSEAVSRIDSRTEKIYDILIERK